MLCPAYRNSAPSGYLVCAEPFWAFGEALFCWLLDSSFFGRCLSRSASGSASKRSPALSVQTGSLIHLHMAVTVLSGAVFSHYLQIS